VAKRAGSGETDKRETGRTRRAERNREKEIYGEISRRVRRDKESRDEGEERGRSRKKGREEGFARNGGDVTSGSAARRETQETERALSRIRNRRKKSDNNRRSDERKRKNREPNRRTHRAKMTNGRWSAPVATFTCSVDRALSASIYVTLYTGPFRPLSVRMNTGFYQLLRRAADNGETLSSHVPKPSLSC